ncbi:MAG: HvfC/BufC family peptide modification chaperone, partial [Dongiaceae bacterium]
CSLVDERFFSYAADAFIRDRPPRAPCLSEYGAEFADFLAAFPATQSLKYLPDVARLEWAINEAYFAPDAPALDPVRIAAVPQDRYAGLIFVAHPSCRLIASAYPVDRIWQAHQPGGDIESGIDPAAGGCRLLVHRQGIDVRMMALDAAGFAFAAAILARRPLQQAYEAAAAIDEAFNLTGALSTHLTRGTFSESGDPADMGETRR